MPRFDPLRAFAAIGCALALGLVATPTHATDPVAIILDVDGTTAPQVEAFQDLQDSLTIDLAPGTRVWLSDYASCAEYEVLGGRIEIAAGKIRLSRTEEVSVTDASCIANLAMSDADLVSAGVVTRTSGATLPVIPERPSFGIAGANAKAYDLLSILIDNRPVLTVPVVNGRAIFPADAQPLTPGNDAVVTISGQTAQRRAVRVRTSSGPAGWVVLD